MKCARLRLQERSKNTYNRERPITLDKPRRYCQKRLVNPSHEEDPRWIDVFKRFHCHNSENTNLDNELNSCRDNQKEEDVFLSVQNIKFQGNENHNTRPKTSFKYKTVKDGNKHRMFVKQVVNDNEDFDEDRESQLTCYYYDDYAKYLLTDHSRPSSEKSSIYLRDLGTKLKGHKAVQVEITKAEDTKPKRKIDFNVKISQSCHVKEEVKGNPLDVEELPETAMERAKIAFHKAGKRKSLTISRAQSPETIQVIRVDVFCNFSRTPTVSDCEDNKIQAKTDNPHLINKTMDTINLKKSHFANRYLLTNTIKSLDENISGGAKVTLVCKTFKLSDRFRRRKAFDDVNSIRNTQK